jgi:hypothetical protein
MRSFVASFVLALIVMFARVDAVAAEVPPANIPAGATCEGAAQLRFTQEVEQIVEWYREGYITFEERKMLMREAIQAFAHALRMCRLQHALPIRGPVVPAQ